MRQMTVLEEYLPLMSQGSKFPKKKGATDFDRTKAMGKKSEKRKFSEEKPVDTFYHFA